MKATILLIIGLIIIITPFLILIWKGIKSKPIPKDIYYICIICLIIGLPVMMIDRITEIPIPYIGIIRANAEKTTTDSNEVSKLKTRVEAQSATIDLVAQKSTIAEKLSTEAKILYEDLSNKNKAADQELKKINDLNNFVITYLKALNDDCTAFEKLGTWGMDNNSSFHDISLIMYRTIRLMYFQQKHIPGGVAALPKEFDVSEYNVADFKASLDTQPPQYHARLVDIVWAREDLTKKERFLFLIEVRIKSNSLKARNMVGIIFEKEYNIFWDPFKYEAIDAKSKEIKEE